MHTTQRGFSGVEYLAVIAIPAPGGTLARVVLADAASVGATNTRSVATRSRPDSGAGTRWGR